MRYLDTGSREPDQALAAWLAAFSPLEVEEIRIQSGFFSIGGIGLLLPIFSHHVANTKNTTILIGSNNGATLRADVLGLAGFMGLPRKNALLGVVSFGNAFFHPKTYHVRRLDGSQAAYVGSANLSAAGLALHVEAGISLDTRDGDDEERLTQIAAAIDVWFEENREGLYLIQDIESVEALVDTKVLAQAPKPKPESSDGKTVSSSSASKSKLKPIVALPPVMTEEEAPADEPKADDDEEAPDPLGISPPTTAVASTPPAPAVASTPPVPGVAGAAKTAVPKNGFPQYLLFDPTATGPTYGASALTGTALPSSAVGLIVQLNLDSARHFMGGKGTANISIPIATIGSIRFGTYGVHSRPRAEFQLRFRYVSATSAISGGVASSNIQGYGYTATENGHVDIRMLVPAEIKAFGETIKNARHKVPTNGDFAFLEWPTVTHPGFSLTFLESGSPLATIASATFAAAVNSGEVVGHGACWLQSGVSPIW